MEWEYGHGDWEEMGSKTHSRTSLLTSNGKITFMIHYINDDDNRMIALKWLNRNNDKFITLKCVDNNWLFHQENSSNSSSNT